MRNRIITAAAAAITAVGSRAARAASVPAAAVNVATAIVMAVPQPRSRGGQRYRYSRLLLFLLSIVSSTEEEHRFQCQCRCWSQCCRQIRAAQTFPHSHISKVMRLDISKIIDSLLIPFAVGTYLLLHSRTSLPKILLRRRHFLMVGTYFCFVHVHVVVGSKRSFWAK